MASDEAFAQLLIVSGIEVLSCVIFTFYMDWEVVGRRGAMLTAWGLVCVSSALAVLLKGDQQLFQVC